jgi:glycerophosphoryl diester phosphodiesterase
MMPVSQKRSTTLLRRAIELINCRSGAETLTETGGPLFSTRMRAAAVRGNWHIWADRGATIIQTDEPKAAIGWLAANGYRVPYADEARPAEPASTAGIN